MTIQTYSKKASGNVQVSDHFLVREFASRDGADEVLIDDKLIRLLEFVRDYFGQPVTITSAYRSPAHNKKVGGSSNSQHVKGTAADIIVRDVDPLQVAEAAEYFLGNRGGVGYYPISKFTHVDVREKASRWYEYKRGQVMVRNPFSVAAVVQKIHTRKEDTEMVESIRMMVDGKQVPVDRILKDGVNYIAIRQVAEALGLKVTAQGNIPVLERQKHTVRR